MTITALLDLKEELDKRGDEIERLRAALNKIAREGGAACDMQAIAMDALGWRKTSLAAVYAAHQQQGDGK